MFTLDALIRGIVLGSRPLEYLLPTLWKSMRISRVKLYLSIKATSATKNTSFQIGFPISETLLKISISDSQANAMCIEVALDEIQVRISLNPNKALDPDGLNGHFLRKA